MLKEEFNEIANSIINTEIFQQLKYEVHHGTTRYDHSMRVAWTAFCWAKKLGLDYKSATRAALFHDLFRKKDCKGLTKKEINRVHPLLAVKNAQEHFGINEIEKDAIINHMYPLTPNKPTSKEGRLLGYADKFVAINEGIKYNNPLAHASQKLSRTYSMLAIVNSN